MGWLFAHDVWPRWTAQQPPKLDVQSWLTNEHRQAQFALFLEGDRIGTIWTNYTGDELSVQRHDLIWVERLPMGLVPMDLTPLRLQADSTFTAEGLLDEIQLRLMNHSMVPTQIHGERFHAAFSFTFEQGPIEQTFKLPLTDGTLITGSFSPVTRMTHLTVGQTWRIQVFNPLSALTGMGDRFSSMLVEVTGKELITTADGVFSCFVVKSMNATAWVDEDGSVRMQEMTLPLLGKLRIVREVVYDKEARTTARKYAFYRQRSEERP